MGLISRAVRAACAALAKRLPKRSIAVDASDVYLERYYLFGGTPTYFPDYCRKCKQPVESTDTHYVLGVCASGGVCDPRPVVGRLSFLPTVYLHRFLRSDADEELHDHPWTGVSFILAGGYREERRVLATLDGRPFDAVVQRTVGPGSVNVIRATDFHRVDLIEADAWTIFATGEKRKSWSFWDRFTGETVPYREHVEPVTRRENLLRGSGLTAIRASRVRCIRGHALTGRNLVTSVDGHGRRHRRCRECRRRADRVYRRRNAGVST